MNKKQMILTTALLSSITLTLNLYASNSHAETPPQRQIIDLSAISLDTLESYRPGQTVKYTGFDGKTYQAIYTGERIPGKDGSPDHFMLSNIVEIDPKTSQPVVDPQSGRSDGDQHSSSNGSGAALGAAISTIAGYIAVPPSMRTELAEKQVALQEAISKGNVQIQMYKQSIVANVTEASAALTQLKYAAEGINFQPPKFSSTSSAGIPSFALAPWELRNSLESSYVTLNNITPASQAHAQVRATGFISLDNALKSLKAGDIDQARAAGALAEAAAFVLRNATDLLVSFNPLTAMARDATELITGRDLLTGEPLMQGEMWMRGVSLGLSLISSGVASTISQSLSKIAPTINAAASVRKLFDNTMQISKHVKHRWWRVGGAGELVTDSHVRDLAFEAITKGKAFWDNKENTTAFFLKDGDRWLQVALDVEKGTVVTVVSRKLDYDFANRISKDQDLIRRFTPFNETPIPTKETADIIKLYLPGK